MFDRENPDNNPFLWGLYFHVYQDVYLPIIPNFVLQSKTSSP